MITRLVLNLARGVATCTHGRTCVPENYRRKVKVDLFVVHAYSKKKTYKEIFQSLLGRMIGHYDYLFVYKQVTNLLSLHDYTFYLVSEAH